MSEGLAELEWLDIHVCVAVSASEFWCQLPSAQAVLSGSTVGLQKARTLQSVENIKVGHLYLVSDPPQTNYRGKVLATDREDSRVTVVKLDYGTEDYVPPSCLYPLAQHQLELPAQAFCCCLDDGEGVTATQDWLNKLISDGEAVDKDLQVKVVGRRPDGTMLVDVREKPGDISDEQSAGTEAEADADGDISKPVAGNEVSLDTLEISQPVMQSTILGDTMSQSRLEKGDGDKDYM